MNDLIEAIRTAVGDCATAEQKATGAQACRTILAALDAEPGKTLILAGAPQPHPLARVSPDQALDLLISRLTTIAEARDAKATAARESGGVPAPPAREATRPRIELIPTPRPTRAGPPGSATARSPRGRRRGLLPR